MIAESPNLLLNRDMIEQLRARIAVGHDLLVQANDQLVALAQQYAKKQAEPVEGVLRVPSYNRHSGEHSRVTKALWHDARAAHGLALAGVIAESDVFAEKAKEILFSWVRKTTVPENGGDLVDWLQLQPRSETPAAVAHNFPNFIYAYDLLKGFDYLDGGEIEEFVTWLRPYVRYHWREHMFKNHRHTWQSLFLVCAGHALTDERVFERGFSFYRNGFRVQVRQNGAMPRELWRSAMAPKQTLAALEAMVQLVQIASLNGEPDLREMKSWYDGDLRQAIDFFYRFLEDPKTWSFYTNNRRLYRPKNVADWGYIFEYAYAWWGDQKYMQLMEDRPYGEDEREGAWTLLCATLQASA